MNRWSTLLLDSTDLAGMATIPFDAVRHHADGTILTRPTNQALYRRWEQQYWVVEDISFERDARHWARIPAETRAKLEKLIINFLVGEYTGLDLLSPLLTACPDEDSLVYLGTQLADESRHTRLMQRLSVELLGLPENLDAALPHVWQMITPAQRRLSTLESALIERLVTSRPNYEDWLRAVAIFHLVTEGVLALQSQRALVSKLRAGGLLPGLRTGFIAMTRDESRHVAFGMQALRRGVQEGFEEAILDVLFEALPLAVAVDVEEGMTESELKEARAVAVSMRDEACLRMRQINLPPEAREEAKRRMNAAIRGMTTIGEGAKRGDGGE